MLPCRESARLINASLERKLGWKEKIQLYLHLRACDLCKRYQRQLRFLSKSLLKDEGMLELDVTLSEEARSRILRRIDEEAAEDSGNA